MSSVGENGWRTFWRDDKSSVCDRIRSRPGFWKILLKTKNERHFLKDWIDYHANIVGLENIIIFDNMSTDKDVLGFYDDLPDDLVLTHYDGFHNFVHKVDIFPELYHALAHSCNYFSFIDTDEFVCLMDGARHYCGKAILDFVKDWDGLDVLPGTWLDNAPRSKDVFHCGLTSQTLEWGLRWGKPTIRSKAGADGIILHNSEVSASFYQPQTPKNLFMLHMKELYPEQRIKVNVGKLIARGFAHQDDRLEDIFAKDLSGVTDGVIPRYIEELKRLLIVQADPVPGIKEGMLRLGSDGRIRYFSKVEEHLVSNFLSQAVGNASRPVGTDQKRTVAGDALDGPEGNEKAVRTSVGGLALAPKDQVGNAMNERVFLSEQNRLYLTGGSNAVTSLFTTSGFDAAVNVKHWATRMSARTEAFGSCGIKYCHLIVPEKLTVYPLSGSDRSQVFGPEEDIVSPGSRLISAAPNDNVLYPNVFLAAQAQKFTIYPASDSHWTWIGAFSAFQCIMSKFKYDLDFFSFLKLPRNNICYHGDLWEASFSAIPAERFERVQLPADIRRVYCNALVGAKELNNAKDDVGLHVGSNCIFVNNSAQIKEAVMIFGTSFSEYRLEPSLLTAIFAYFFETVHFVWSTSLDFDYIRRHSPHLVLAEMPERFLTYCPDDRLEIESFSAERIQQWRAARSAERVE